MAAHAQDASGRSRVTPCAAGSTHSRPVFRGILELILNDFEGRIPICIIKCSNSFKHLGVVSAIHYKMFSGCCLVRIVQEERLCSNYRC